MAEDELTIVVIGAGGVGKTATTVMLTQGTFDEEYNPTIEDTYQKELTVDGEKSVLNILDTAGQEEYKVIQDQYWRQGDGFIIVFDCTNKHSFEEVAKFHVEVQKAKEDEYVPIVLCGNKCDLEDLRVVKREEASALAKKHSWVYFDSSAKNNVNIQESFTEIVKMIRKKKMAGVDTRDKINKNIGLKAAETKKKSSGGLFGFFKKKK